MEAAEDDNWMPLESNPEVINTFIKELGFDVSQFSLVDVLSTEPWAQEMVPQPVSAVFFLYPISQKQKEYAKVEAEKLKTDDNKVSSNVFFMKQHAANACGTVAAFHAIVNMNRDYPDLIAKESFFANFIDNTKTLNAEERGNYFKKDKGLEKAHKKAVKKGQSEVTARVSTHFIAFVEVDGSLYELDGRKSAPVNHGPCKGNEVLAKSCNVIQGFMDRDPGELRFTIMALAFAGGNQFDQFAYE